MTVVRAAGVREEELVASVEARAAVARLVESGEVPVGCAPRSGDWTMPTCGPSDLLLMSPSPSDDEPIEDVHRSVDELEHMLAL